VVGVLRPAQPGLDDGETGLHEHDEEAGDERPSTKLIADLVLAHQVDDVGDRQAFLRIGDPECPRPSPVMSGRVAFAVSSVGASIASDRHR